MREEVEGRDSEELEIRRHIHRRLELTREIGTYVIVVGVLALIDWATGGDWWAQWIAIIWGAFLAFRLLGEFGTSLWGREAEDRMVENEVKRRRDGR